VEHYRYALKQPVLDYKELSEQVSGFQSDDNSATEESVDEKADKQKRCTGNHGNYGNDSNDGNNHNNQT
jgi:hypothetical protein